MGSTSDKKYWLDRNWYWLVIGFGVVCVLGIDFFHPFW